MSLPSAANKYMLGSNHATVEDQRLAGTTSLQPSHLGNCGDLLPAGTLLGQYLDSRMLKASSKPAACQAGLLVCSWWRRGRAWSLDAAQRQQQDAALCKAAAD